MEQQEQTPAGFWAWEPAGKAVRILIDLALVDRLMSASVDGLGAVPRRGAEIGGILTGSRERLPSGVLEVEITDWIAVPCAHKFGPSYVFSSEDLQGLAAAIEQAGGKAVGFFRSHTREGLTLSAEDLQYCQEFFPGPDDVVLLVKPSAMKVSLAGFFCYENGSLQDATPPLLFPFRRSELETGEAPARRPLGEKRAAAPEPAPPPPPAPAAAAASAPAAVRKQHGMEGVAGIAQSVAARAEQEEQEPEEQQESRGLLPYPAPAMSGGRLRKNWVWFPLSFVFLLLGVLLGFQAALVITGGKNASPDPYSLGLTVERRGEDLSVRWDRNNPAVRTASKGVIDISDGRFTKRVDLDSSQLQTGSVIYRFSSSDVRFRLEVQPRDRTVMMESIDWKGK